MHPGDIEEYAEKAREYLKKQQGDFEENSLYKQILELDSRTS